MTGKRGRLKEYQYIQNAVLISVKNFAKNTGRQIYKCNEYERHFYEETTYHKHSEKNKLLALKMYSKGISKFGNTNVFSFTNIPFNC